MLYDQKFVIVSPQKSFGERFDHFNQSVNILQTCRGTKNFFTKNENLNEKKKFIGLSKFHGIIQIPEHTKRLSTNI